MPSNEGLKGGELKFKELQERYRAFMEDMKKEGTLSFKVKLLIGLAIGVVKNCEPCVRGRVLEAREAGATEEEVVEACFMAVQMDGGPSSAYTYLYVLKALGDYEKGARYADMKKAFTVGA